MAEQDDPGATGPLLRELTQRVAKLAEEVAHMQSARERTGRDRFWDVVAKVAVAVALPLSTSAFGWAWVSESRIVQLESTSAKAIDVERLAGALRAEIAVMANGPEWMRKQLSAVESKVDRLLDDSSKVKERLAAVEQQSRR